MSDDRDVHERLAEKLDRMPNGFPAAPDRVDLDLLRWTFTAEEAELAFALPAKPMTAAGFAERLNRPVEEIAPILDRMCKQGQIVSFKMGGEFKFISTPWLPGIQEGQLHRPDKTQEQVIEFVHLWERYFPTFAKTSSYGPAYARVVPVSQGVASEASPHRLDDIHRMLDIAKTFWVMPCVCRKERSLIDKACNHSSQVCLMASVEEETFEKWPDVGRVISREEAFKILDQAKEEGLVHQTWNADNRTCFFICNCCPCCCVFLRPMTEFGQTHATASAFVASVDVDECVQCGDCLDDRCPVEAIAEDDGVYSVATALCLGCGVCTVKCPVDAIKLDRKPDAAEPLTPGEWAKNRVMARPEIL